MARSSLIPGFRFHPTDVELVMYYLKRKLLGKKITVKAVAEVNIYDFSPWDLPDKSALKSGDLEWYFFCPKAKKYSNGGRSNRATERGFWKATGKDRAVKYQERTVATIKTLVFHVGHAGKGQRTDWVMHEYKMEDEHLAKAGIVQDMYVLCKIFEKSGHGPRNGAQYGAPFNEEEWNGDLSSCSDSQLVVGLVGASDKTVNQQKGALTTMNMTEPGSSIVTNSANQSTDTLNDKPNGPAEMNMNESGLSIVTFSANGPTNTLDDMLNSPAAMNMDQSGSSIVKFSANQPTNILNDKQKGPAAIMMTEPGPSTVTFSVDEPTIILNDKQSGPVAMNMTLPQAMNSDVIFFDDDFMFLEDFDVLMGSEVGSEEIEAVNVEKVKSGIPNNNDGIYDELVNLVDLEVLNETNFKTDGAEYTLDRLFTPDELDADLGQFYVN